ncbi:PhzF family phenazine biosynthesis protein, partial [Corynebacterium diphtheriae]
RTPRPDYRVRIFTRREEFDFAGHPTLGSALAWRRGPGSPRPRSWLPPTDPEAGLPGADLHPARGVRLRRAPHPRVRARLA